jgi:long-subunit fatty acid transport protein
MLAVGALAQSSSEVNAGLQWNLLNPGAYSLGMGGAFIGGADDATAAYANPAGLVNISRPEVSVEWRTWRHDHVVPYRGHGFGPATQEGTDNVEGVEQRAFRSNTRAISFASVVWPSSRWAISAYQHELARYDASPQSAGIFFTIPGEQETTFGRTFPTASDIHLRVVSRGVAMGFRLTGKLSVGAELSAASFALDSRTDRYDFRRVSEADFTPANIRSTAVQKGHGTGLRVGGGILWEPFRSVRIGAVYRHEPSFPVDVTASAPDNPHVGTCRGRFHLPDVYGVGVSVRPFSFLSFNADYNRIRYSELTRDFVVIGTADCKVQPVAADYVTRDGDEFHAGVRYVLAGGFDALRQHPLVMTAGWWQEAPHALEFKDRQSPRSLVFPPARADHHYSAGVGILFNSHWQLSVGMDVSRRQRIFSVSTLNRW